MPKVIELSRLSPRQLRGLSYDPEREQDQADEISEFLAAIEQPISQLKYRERHILRMAFGLAGPRYSLREIAKTFSLSDSRIGQLVNRGLRRIRIHLEERRQIQRQRELAEKWDRQAKSRCRQTQETN